jgi:hypothetical protein
MLNHKFNVGQLVHIASARVAGPVPQGAYRIERLMPFEAGEFLYRLKPLGGGPERVVRESQLGGRSVAKD